MPKAKIMIVEDDRIVAKDIENTLKDLGFYVSSIVSSAQGAIDKAKEKSPDLVLMDIVLKGEMDGIEAANHIRTQFNIPVVYLTAYADKKLLQRAKITEPLGYIIKPFEERELNAAIEIAIYRHRIEKKLKEGEEKYRTILESIEDGYYEVDIKGNLAFLNDSTCRILGYSKDELMGMNNREYMDQENAEKAYKTFNRVYKTGKPVKGFDCEFIRNDGTKRHIEASVSLIKDAGGNPAGFRGIFRDVTERKKMEIELIRTKNFLQNIFDSSIDGITTTDLHGNVIYTSPRAKDILGYEPEEVIGKKIYSFYGNGKEDAKAIMKELTEKGGLSDHEVKYIRKDGELVDVNVSASLLMDEKREVIGTLGIYRDITEKKRTEEELNREKEKFQVLVEKSPLGISLIGKDDRYKYINPMFVEIFGYTMEDIPTGREWFRKAYPDEEYRKQAISTWINDVKESEAEEFHPPVFTVKCKDGSEKAIHFRMVIMETGEQLVIYEDITDRKQAEDSLKESEGKYRSLVESTEDSIYLLDRNCMYLFINEKHLSRFGFPLHKVIGRPYAEFHSEDDTKDFVRKVEKVFETGESLYYEYRSERDGGYFLRTLSPVKEPDGSTKAVTVISKDINEFKQAEEALQESEDKYRLVTDNITDLVSMCDSNGTFIYTSPSHQTILGYDPESLIGLPIYTMVHPDDLQYIKDTIKGKTKRLEAGTAIFRMRHNDGHYLWFESRSRLLFDLEGKLKGAVFNTRNITDRVRADEELRSSQEQLRNLATYLQSAREQERTSIAREIHDELAQALTALKMDISWLGKKLPKDQKILLEKAKAMTKLTDTTIKTVKRISTELRPGLLDDLGLEAAIEWQVGEFQDRTGITCELIIDPEDIILDRDRSTTIFRIFQETLTNIARHAKAKRVTVSLKEKADELVLKVIDNGKGITEKQISDPKSFGLIGIRERVHPWGGEVKISGIPDKGTTVEVRMPIKE